VLAFANYTLHMFLNDKKLSCNNLGYTPRDLLANMVEQFLSFDVVDRNVYNYVAHLLK